MKSGGLLAASRKRQVAALKQRILETVPHEAPVIVAGDFNDWQGHVCARLQQDVGLTEAFSLLPPSVSSHMPPHPFFTVATRAAIEMQHYGLKTPWLEKIARVTNGRANGVAAVPARSFPSTFPFLCLDRVYIRHFTVSHTAVQIGVPWNTLSDHIPLSVDLQWG